MKAPAARRSASVAKRPASAPLRVAFLGPRVWLESCAPDVGAAGILPARIPLGPGCDLDRADAELKRFDAHATIVFDPLSVSTEPLRGAGGAWLGVLVGGLPQRERATELDAFDRLLSFDPSLTRQPAGRQAVWRAIPPPVSDALFQDVRPLHGPPRTMSVGRSTLHREAILLPAKHHHDLLQLLHGVSGAPLGELLAEYDVGVYVPPRYGGGFGQQIGMHLAAGQLLLVEGRLRPAHGLERNIDYLQIESGEDLVRLLDRLTRFPEMHQRIRVRGRLKAEQYRSSRLFARLVHDLLADLATFGPSV
jgi:hypothetical protein